ncbi:MAG: hypothetical protein V1874_16815 [Spirochaetota bacterium]
MNKLSIFLSIVIFNLFTWSAFAEKIIMQNTLSYKNTSSRIENNIMKNNSLLNNSTASSIDEEFSIYFCNKNTYFFGFSGIYSYNETYVRNHGLDLFFGSFSGKERTPFIIIGFGVYDTKDNVFQETTKGNSSTFFQIGYMNDLHLKIKIYGINLFVINDAGGDTNPSGNSDDSALFIDIALGKRSFCPLFLRLNFDVTSNEKHIINSNNYDDDYYYYDYATCLLHIQYYSDKYEISFGCTLHEETFQYGVYNKSSHDYTSYYIKDNMYYGIGSTFKINNIYKDLNLFGELHVLKDFEHNKIISITKLGSEYFF